MMRRVPAESWKQTRGGKGQANNIWITYYSYRAQALKQRRIREGRHGAGRAGRQADRRARRQTGTQAESTEPTRPATSKKPESPADKRETQGSQPSSGRTPTGTKTSRAMYNLRRQTKVSHESMQLNLFSPTVSEFNVIDAIFFLKCNTEMSIEELKEPRGEN
jgi:hypothetical protein